MTMKCSHCKIDLDAEETRAFETFLKYVPDSKQGPICVICCDKEIDNNKGEPGEMVLH